jgi:hypothetical protein
MGCDYYFNLIPSETTIGLKKNGIFIEPNPLENQEFGTKAFEVK